MCLSFLRFFCHFCPYPVLFVCFAFFSCAVFFSISSTFFFFFSWATDTANRADGQPGVYTTDDIISFMKELNAMKRFCLCSLRSHLNVLIFFPPDRGMLRRSRCFQIFLLITHQYVVTNIFVSEY